MRLVRYGALAATPWANRGGETRVIVDQPGHFRLSLATIARTGAFSHLPGLWRQFALVSGRVVLAGSAWPDPRACDAGSPPVGFDGGDAVHCTLPGAAAIACNLMQPHGATRLRLTRADHGRCDDALALVACGPVALGDGALLALGDAVLWPTGAAFSGRALLLR